MSSENSKIKMNKGIKLLIARIDSRPEEFGNTFNGEGIDPRWEFIIEQALNVRQEGKNNSDDLQCLTLEEINALADKYLQLQATNFHTYVMDNLINPQPNEEAHSQQEPDLTEILQSYKTMPSDVYITPNHYKDPLWAKLKDAQQRVKENKKYGK